MAMAPRRSTRLQAATRPRIPVSAISPKHLTPQNHSHDPFPPTTKVSLSTKRKRSASNSSSNSSTSPNANPAPPPRAPKRRRRRKTAALLDDSASDCGDEDTTALYAEYGEQAALSHDHFEYHAGHDLGSGSDASRATYDSRVEEGNEEYECGSFVVGSEPQEGYDDADTYCDEDEEYSESEGEESEEEEEEQIYHRVNKLRRNERRESQRRRESRISQASPRTRVSTSSNGTGIFIASPRGRINPSRRVSSISPAQVTPWSTLGYTRYAAVEAPRHSDDMDAQPLITEASAEILEEITDAISLFLRRKNQSRTPLRLRLAAAALQDEEIREALEDTLRLGLGRKLSYADGSKRWSIGARGRR